ncbi:MAG TPA: lipid A-modifier LpxR family protein, partial [Flavitalea sp.]|nr:lipid A-modifier LpxR family protein [Flavitalea sp.]
MKKYLPCCLLVGIVVLSGINKLLGQSQAPSRIFRLYEDNDILNIRGNGSDRSYTNGLRFDLFYIKNHASR